MQILRQVSYLQVGDKILLSPGASFATRPRLRVRPRLATVTWVPEIMGQVKVEVEVSERYTQEEADQVNKTSPGLFEPCKAGDVYKYTAAFQFRPGDYVTLVIDLPKLYPHG